MTAVIVFWISVALTATGPIPAVFSDETACRQAVALARVCSQVLDVSPCEAVTLRDPR